MVMAGSCTGLLVAPIGVPVLSEVKDIGAVELRTRELTSAFSKLRVYPITLLLQKADASLSTNR